MTKWKTTALLTMLVTALVALALATSGCSQAAPEDTNAANTQPATTPAEGASSSTAAPEATDLVVEDLVQGTGTEAQAGNYVTVHYTGWLTDGTKFDSSLDRNQPFEFNLGAGEVIAGWDMGVAGMKVGGKRKLTIPASLGYGDMQVGAIPAGSTLIFEVELLGVR